MTKYWVVIANSTIGKIFQCQDYAKDFALVDELYHDESKLKTSELVSDRSGEYRSYSGNVGGSFIEMTDPHEYEKIEFAREISNFLDSARANNDFDNLIIVAPPHFLGLLNKQLSKNTLRLTHENIQKDYTERTLPEVASYLHDNWRDIVAN